MAESGVRERKKHTTRSALIATGLRLFITHSFDSVTTEEIAAEVGVSQRTLFRYFDTKSDIVLAARRDWQERFNSCLRTSSGAQSMWDMLVSAADELLNVATDAELAEQVRVAELVGENPALLAAFLKADQSFQDMMVDDVLARHDVARERARVVVSAFSSMDYVASRVWLAQRHPTRSSRIDLLHHCARTLADELSAGT